MPNPRGSGGRAAHFLAGRWFVSAALLLIAGLTAILYGNTLPFPFVFDDCVYLTENPFAFGEHCFGFLSDPCGFATSPAKMGLDPDFALNIMLRPFAYFVFYLNYLVCGLNPAGFRVVNIVIHAANGCLVFVLLRHLILKSAKVMAKREASAAFVPLAAALLFVAHPLQTESVTYVIQRFTSMGAFFCLTTLWLHLLANGTEGRGRRIMLRAASIVAAVLGMLSKESTVTAPVMAVLLDWLIMGTAWRTAARRALPLLLSMGIVPGLVLFTTWAENNGRLSWGAAINIANRDDVPRSHYEYFLTSLRVVVSYLRLLLIPVNQNLDPKVEWSHSITEWRVLLCGAGIIGIVAAAWMIFRRRAGDLHGSLILTFTLFFFAALVISSGLVPLPDVMAEHRTYKPSIGGLVVLVCLLDLARRRFFARGLLRGVAPLMVAVWVVGLSGATFARNEVWRSDITLWADTVAKSPLKYRPWANLGAAYAEHGQLAEAVSCYETVISLEPRVMVAYSNLAAVLNRLQRCREAVEVCQRAKAMQIDIPEIDHNLGLAECVLGHFDAGIPPLLRVLERRPEYRPTHLVLGAVYVNLKRERQGLDHLRRAAALGPEDPALNRFILELESRMGLGMAGSAAQ